MVSALFPGVRNGIDVLTATVSSILFSDVLFLVFLELCMWYATIIEATHDIEYASNPSSRRHSAIMLYFADVSINIYGIRDINVLRNVF